MEKCLCFSDEIVDRFIAITRALDNDLPGSLLELLRLGDAKWNLALLLLRAFVRNGNRFLGGRGRLCIDHRWLNFLRGAACRRTSSKDQGHQYEQSERSRVSGRCVHATECTRAGQPFVETRSSNPEARVITRTRHSTARLSHWTRPKLRSPAVARSRFQPGFRSARL